MAKVNELQERIERLEKRVRALEARPQYYPPIVYIQPMYPWPQVPQYPRYWWSSGVGTAGEASYEHTTVTPLLGDFHG
jgi:hypothetical protein